MSVLDSLLDFAVDTHWLQIPTGTRKHVVTLLRDAVTVAAAGDTAPGCPELLNLVQEWQIGAGGASVLYRDMLLPPPETAMVNGTLIEAWDYDDTHDAGIVHCTASVLSTALAICEWQGREVAGTEFLAAVAVGLEVLARLGMASTSPLTWTRTATLGGIASALVAARLLGLDRDRILNAAGIAYMQAAGNSQTIVDAATAKKMQVGFAARAGTLAAMLASRGLTGPRAILEGAHGYYVLYERGQHHLEASFASLGRAWELDNIGIKLFPCARDTHAAIEALLDATRGRRIGAGEVASVEVEAPQLVVDVAGRSVRATGPPAIVAAILSVPYTVAVALLEGTVQLRDFTPQQIEQPERRSLSERVAVRVNPGAPANGLAPVSVRVHLAGGAVLEGMCTQLRTGIELARDEAALARKREDCLQSAGQPLAPGALARAELVLSRADQESDLPSALIHALNASC